jgi:hypothetical protein|tara:strand:- start:118 stop:642 length:525 start_codon:yes stop_codon:yes gene_type:complete
MKALITGGSSKFGEVLVSQLAETYDVTVITRQHLLDREFDSYKGDYDLIFFNHNMPQAGIDHEEFGGQYDDTPQRILRDTANNPYDPLPCKVGWMLTKQACNLEEHMLTDTWDQAYVAQKALFICEMRFWAEKYTTFCIQPGGLQPKEVYPIKAKRLIEFVGTDFKSGTIHHLK